MTETRMWSHLRLSLWFSAAVAAIPVASAIGMVDYLKQISGKSTVAGIHNRFNSRSDWFTKDYPQYGTQHPAAFTNYAKQSTGKTPGLWGGDFLFDSGNAEPENRWKMIYEAEKQYKSGALVNILYHACSPRLSPQQLCDYSDNTNGAWSKLSDAEWRDLITDGGSLNRSWKARLDDLTQYFKYLQDKEVPVMFRPFHEMNQEEFWWGGRPGADGTRRIYQITHDYLVNTKGLTNIVWVWNVQDFGGLRSDVNSYNPGSEYWDIATLDVYSGFDQWKYDAMVSVAGNKPIAIGECDVIPDGNILVNQPKWTFFMSWSELTWKVNSADKVRSVYGRSNVVTLDEMPGWSTTSPQLLGDWEMCSTSSQCRNGCCSSKYSNDGKLKCTPLTGGHQADICIGGGSTGPPPSSCPVSGTNSYYSPSQARYLSAWDNGSVLLQSHNQAWEKWTRVDMGNCRFALRSQHGNYLSAWTDGSVHLSSWAKEWESWKQIQNNDGTISLLSYHQTYLSSWDDGSIRLSPHNHGWEHFRVGN